MNSVYKIVVFTTNDLTYDQRMDRICTVLRNSGHEVTLCGRRFADSQIVGDRDYRVFRYRCLFNRGPWFYLEINLRFFFAFIFRSADLIYSVDNDTLPASILLRSIKRVPLIFDSHEWFPEVPELANSPIKKNIWRKVGKIGARKASLCITVSNTLAHQLERETGRNFVVIRNVPVWHPDKLPLSRSKEPLIVYQGALNAGRGLRELILAVHDLPPWECWLIGEGDLSEGLRELVSSLNLDQRVIFKGHLEPAELRTITPLAWVGYNLLDSVSKSYYYSLANKFFDYMHAGVPSLNPPFPEYEEILHSYRVGETCSSPDPQLIKEAITKYFSSLQEIEMYASKCREASNHFNWQTEAKILIHHIHSIEI